jgi:hypothetical protein
MDAGNAYAGGDGRPDSNVRKDQNKGNRYMADTQAVNVLSAEAGNISSIEME